MAITSDAALRAQLNALLSQVDNPAQSLSDLLEITGNLPLIEFLDLRYLGQATGGGGGGGSGPGPGGLIIIDEEDGTYSLTTTGITQLFQNSDGSYELIAAGTVSILENPDSSFKVTA